MAQAMPGALRTLRVSLSLRTGKTGQTAVECRPRARMRYQSRRKFFTAMVFGEIE
jgi:hypothetical protein